MKTIKFLSILVIAFSIISNVNAQSNLAAWHFDALAAAPNTPKIIQADYGLQANNASIYLDGTHGSSDWNSTATNPELTAFAGNITNDQRPSPLAGQALALANLSANNKGVVFALSTENYENIKISYAYRASSTGFNIHRWFYSINGTDFIKIDSVFINRDLSWHTINLDFSSIGAINDLSSLLLKLVVDSASSTSANNRIDNFYITGEEITPLDIIPPTMTYASAISNTQAKIAFSEPVDATAENVNNYSITVGVSSAVRLTGLDSVLLTFNQPLAPNTKYELCVSGIQDLAGNAMTSTECDSIEWITIIPQDTIPPEPLDAWLESLTEVKVSFNEPVDASAENTANYTGINVATATRNTTLDTVTLTLSTPIANATPTTMYVSNISDTAGNVNTNTYEFTLFMDTVVHTPNWVITEIMYNPPESGIDSLEFIEIMNNTAYIMNFKDYTLKYSTNSYTFTEDLFVDPYGYVLVAPVANKASAFYGKTFIQGHTSGISNSGTSIVIIDPNGITVDTVRYYTTAPWPTDANANGYSLSLCDPNLDNNIGDNWSLGTRPFSIVNNKMVYADPGEGCFVAPDTIPPTPLNAWATSYSTVKISFDEPVNNSAENINNYSGLDISSAIRNANHDTVTLTLATPLQNAVHYTLSITNIADEAGNINSNIYDFDIFIDLSAPSIVITEIMYNPPESGTDSLEFIELYNNDTYTVNMNEYTLTYGTNTFTFPDGITIAPNAFLIIAPNATAVNNFYGVTAIQGSTGGIPNTGTTIVFKTPYGVVVDTLTFGSGAPWPTEANGQGPSLTLCDPNSDNTDPANWSISDNEFNIVNGYMVKADPNSLCIIDNNITNFNKEIVNIYPNPASDKVFINTNKDINSIVIYDILGNKVAHYEQVNNNQYIVDVNNLLAQIYIVKIVFIDNSVANQKLIIE
ncbi:MAG: lamin tail domain-containing protein [Bacteroidales bacterium]|nr:lamin tail domain-containing protein [Bacteroidales bacterium]